MAVADRSNWTDLLSGEDLAFIKRFVLLSGSLKALAKAYDISYPTVRLRLDRVIQKIEVIDEQQDADEFERTARLLVADGRLDADAFRSLINAHRKTQESH
ncbi:MAG: hypothetical protein CMJ18_26925 [Phycisphaeraceae bacterium]|nr:hypothetical protein [Phycisphaeraceae bacterium]